MVEVVMMLLSPPQSSFPLEPVVVSFLLFSFLIEHN